VQELIIFRHAKTLANSESGRDFDRDLKQRGRDDALAQADWMREVGLRPQRILCSTAARARQTAEIVCPHLGIDACHVEYLVSMYLASTGDLVRALEQHAADSIMLVGHNPGLEHLVSFFSGSHQHLSTAAIAHITFDPPTQGTPQPNTGHLVTVRNRESI
jgi:phosphohistidine phosphatase